eukprot:259569-Amphidinium_carterae.1
MLALSSPFQQAAAQGAQDSMSPVRERGFEPAKKHFASKEEEEEEEEFRLGGKRTHASGKASHGIRVRGRTCESCTGLPRELFTVPSRVTTESMLQLSRRLQRLHSMSRSPCRMPPQQTT